MTPAVVSSSAALKAGMASFFLRSKTRGSVGSVGTSVTEQVSLHSLCSLKDSKQPGPAASQLEGSQDLFGVFSAID